MGSQRSHTRRALLSAVGGSTVVSLAGCTTAAGRGPRVETAEPDSRAFSDETIERARRTGRAVRASVLAMSAAPPDVQGTGWYFRTADVAVTAGHLLVGSDGWVAWQPDGTSVSLTPLGESWLSGTDAGAVRTDEPGEPLPAGDDDRLDRGQPLLEVGNPGATGNWVVSLGRYLGPTDEEAGGFRSTVPAQGGSSGAPTLTLDGEVVGLHSGRNGPTGDESVYGPDDHPLVSEHVGIDAIDDALDGWLDG